MGLAGITIRTMPDSPSADLEALKASIKHIVESENGKIIDHVEEPVAFGLKAVASVPPEKVVTLFTPKYSAATVAQICPK